MEIFLHMCFIFQLYRFPNSNNEFHGADLRLRCDFAPIQGTDCPARHEDKMKESVRAHNYGVRDVGWKI